MKIQKINMLVLNLIYMGMNQNFQGNKILIIIIHKEIIIITNQNSKKILTEISNQNLKQITENSNQNLKRKYMINLF